MNHLYQVSGIPHSTTCTKICDTGFHIFRGPQTAQCTKSGVWSSTFGSCERTALVFAGGEDGKEPVQTVEVFGSNKKLAPLPKPSSWGSMGFVDGELVFCGGQDKLRFHKKCWYFDKQANVWRVMIGLLR